MEAVRREVVDGHLYLRFKRSLDNKAIVDGGATLPTPRSTDKQVVSGLRAMLVDLGGTTIINADTLR